MKGLILFSLLATGATWGAAEKVGTIDWANRPERPVAVREGYLPSATVENADGTLLTVYYQAETAQENPCLMATKWRLLK